jgi:hypothetical protein
MRILHWKRVVVVGVLAVTFVSRPGFADCKPENPNTWPGIKMVPEGTITTPVTLGGSTGATTEIFEKCQNSVWMTIRKITTPSQ